MIARCAERRCDAKTHVYVRVCVEELPNRIMMYLIIDNPWKYRKQPVCCVREHSSCTKELCILLSCITPFHVLCAFARIHTLGRVENFFATADMVFFSEQKLEKVNSQSSAYRNQSNPFILVCEY